MNKLSFLGGIAFILTAAFIACFAYRNVDAKAAITVTATGGIAGVALYGYLTLVLKPFHYVHCMFITLLFCIALALFVNRFVFGRRASMFWQHARVQNAATQ